MVHTYTYTQSDFKSTSDIDIGNLQEKIEDLSLTSATILYISASGIGSPTFYVGLFFDQELSAPELVILNNLIENYVYIKVANVVAVLTDSRSSGTNGGTFTAGSWVTRQINTISTDQNFCQLASNQFTLQPGLYTITATGTAYGVKNHQMRLRCVTDTETVAVSPNGYSTFSNDLLTLSTTINITEEKTYELHHQCTETQENYGFGRGVGFGESEQYVSITIINNSTI